MNRLKTYAWWYWCLTVPALAFAVAQHQSGLFVAIILCVIQIGHFYSRERSVAAFPVQVRVAYLGLLLLSLLPGGLFILWIQLIGTSAMVTINYCLLARVLTLMPWNRNAPLTYASIRDTLFSPPVTGSVHQQTPTTTAKLSP